MESKESSPTMSTSRDLPKKGAYGGAQHPRKPLFSEGLVIVKLDSKDENQVVDIGQRGSWFQ